LKRVVAVTGGTGKIGLRLIEHLLKAGYHVCVLVRSQPQAEHPLLRANISLTVMDLSKLHVQDVRDWLSVVRPQALIHTAALAHVADCEHRPDLAYLLNTSTTHMLAQACAEYQVHFVFLSTEYVFDGMLAPGLLYREHDRVNPLNYYGKSKALGEVTTQEECVEKTLWTICRTSMVYGSMQQDRPDFVQWVRTMLEQQRIVSLPIDQVNSPTYAPDLVRMLVAVVEQRLQGVYHVCGSKSLSRYRFGLKVAQCYGFNQALIEPVCTPEPGINLQRPLNVGLCVEKITADTGIYPLSLEEGLYKQYRLEQERRENSYERTAEYLLERR